MIIAKYIKKLARIMDYNFYKYKYLNRGQDL
ncbi:MAG: Unknown protein [uncultured Sulfurovum sp.]|uniref:Uncharacterized protein n=1 Tax=uncultured Sulfurovum sp. TaxID=269237 RepID=A0A6S6S6G9_9BACT|nr:MAG: Unknown protein [uncultured Sulfurovum sp.]